MQVHLVDGTYELFRQFLAPRPGHRDADGVEVGATRAVVGVGARRCSKSGATHLGVATDHVIPSFRNDLWAGYKTGEGIDPELFAQFQLLEDALEAMGVDGVADGRARGRRRAREQRARRGRGPARRAGDHLHARQGPRAVRRRQGRAARPAQGDPARRRRRARQVRRRRPSRSPTSSRSWATAPTASPACPGSAPRPRPRCLRRYGHVEAIPDDGRTWDVAGLAQRRPARGDARRRARSGRRASRCSRRCAPTPTSAPSTTGGGPGPTEQLRRLVRATRHAQTPRPRACARQHEENVVTDAVLVETVGDGITQLTLNRPGAAQRDELRARLRALRRVRRARRGSRVPRDRAHRRRPRILRRPRPHRGRVAAVGARARARAGGHDRAEDDRGPRAEDALDAAADHRRGQRRGVGRRARARAGERRAHRGADRALQRRVRARRPVGLRHRRVVAAAPPDRRVARVRAAAHRPAHRRGRSRSHRARHARRRRRRGRRARRSRPRSSSSATARSACA